MALWLSLAMACHPTTPAAAQTSALRRGKKVMSFVLQTEAFPEGGEIPAKYTCSGEDVSPALSWNDAPTATKSFVLLVEDPDAPSGTFTHWVVYDLPANARHLREGVAKSDDVPGGGRQGRNDSRRIGYAGPCPPPGKPHRYVFKLFALDRMLDVASGAAKGEVESAMRGHVLAHAEFMGRFAR
jgi:Raf kinase inhibitor-like YbhB/YbcL family protein